MCLTIKYKTKEEFEEKKKPLKAKEDIKVWKVFLNQITMSGKELFSPYKSFFYERGFIYYEEDMLVPRNLRFLMELQIDRGLHAFRTKNRAKQEHLEWGGNTYSVIIECIIPKGSYYYVNKTEIVSNQLLIPHGE